MRSLSHKSRESWQVLNHLMHPPQPPSPQERALLVVNTENGEQQGLLTPSHCSITRSQVPPGRDLVVISHGSGWVGFKITDNRLCIQRDA